MYLRCIFDPQLVSYYPSITNIISLRLYSLNTFLTLLEHILCTNIIWKTLFIIVTTTFVLALQSLVILCYLITLFNIPMCYLNILWPRRLVSSRFLSIVHIYHQNYIKQSHLHLPYRLQSSDYRFTSLSCIPESPTYFPHITMQNHDTTLTSTYVFDIPAWFYSSIYFILMLIRYRNNSTTF